MTYAPYSLVELQAYWRSQKGVSLGIVGDTDHATRGVSYHLGKDQLAPGAYSATRPRDKRGLTNAASAIDLGRLRGSYVQLRAFSDWLARRCVKGDPGTADVVEVIYSPDGKRVLGFKDGVDFLIPNYGDNSHLTHTHISFFRDSEARNKTALFAPYFESEEETVVRVKITANVVGSVTVKGAGHSLIRADGALVAVPDGDERECVAGVELLEPIDDRPGDRKSAWMVGRRLSPSPEPANFEATYLLKSDAVTHLSRIEDVP